MSEQPGLTLDVVSILLRLVLAGVIGGVIGYERRMHQKAIGIAGMMLVGIGSATYMMLAQDASRNDDSAVSRTLQGILQGIGFLGGAVIFKGGTDVRGIKSAAAIWITGAIGMACGTGFWPLAPVVGAATAAILFVADISSPAERQQEADEESGKEDAKGGALQKAGSS